MISSMLEGSGLCMDRGIGSSTILLLCEVVRTHEHCIIQRLSVDITLSICLFPPSFSAQEPSFSNKATTKN